MPLNKNSEGGVGSTGGGGGTGGGRGGGSRGAGSSRTSSTRTSQRVGKPAKKTVLNTRGNKGLVPEKFRKKLVEREKENAADKRDFGPRWGNKAGRKITKVSTKPPTKSTRPKKGSK